MLLRLRRASIALLGLVGAVGLGLVFFISQIGWPGVLSGPLPGAPSRVGQVHDAVALTHPGPAIATARPAAGGVLGVGSTKRGGRGSLADSQRSHSKKLPGATGVNPGHGTDQPTSPQPTAEPAPVTPAPSPPTVAAVDSSPPPSTSEPVKTSSSTNAGQAAVAKAVSDSGKSATTTATKSQAQKSSKDQGSSSESSKSSDASSAKAHRDESAAKAKAKAQPPAVTPEKSTTAPAAPATAKEAADAAKASPAAH